MMIISVFALPWIRRAPFEWLRYTLHHFFLILFSMRLHYIRAPLSISFPASPYILCRQALSFVCILFGRHGPNKVGGSRRSGNQNVNRHSRALWWILCLSQRLEWLPYSLTSAPQEEGQCLVFYLKGAKTWARVVIEEAIKAKANDGSDLTVRVDGFYSPPLVDAL
jgi:hypothetical protein